jgi:caa(3)-type oxidase subunit IV
MSESEHKVDLNSYIRRCGLVLLAIVCTTSLMIYASFLPHFGWPAKVTMILAIAAVNAFVVASFLMHLLSEKKMVFTVLAFTVCFFIGLMGLTLWAMQDFPTGTATH